ncbi:MAG: hypothetical protein DRO67_00125 [Candidatus Asgardarchaeum californiense]|nr:MAG: hypothetical protein DRO67_00125 [Candidatus Asgardarchaeum californiense]
MMIPSGLNKQVGRGYKIISSNIISILVKERGTATLDFIEKETGLKAESLKWAADILLFLQSKKILTIKENIVAADLAKIQAIREQEKTLLPDNYGKPWSENDTAILCEMSLADKHPHEIALKLKRTEKAVLMRQTFLRNVGRTIPWVDRNPIIKEFVEVFKSPNPEK